MSRKVFTADEVLTAEDVNSFLMDQTVMSFAGTAARGSAISSPVTGMTTYLEDSKNLEIYDGSSYTSPSGMTLLATSSPSAATTVNVNNVFSASYQNYVIYYNVIASTTAGLAIRLRASGSDATTGYTFQFLEASATTVSANRNTVNQNFSLGTMRSSGRLFGRVELSNPFAAAETSYTLSYQDGFSGAILGLRSGSHSTASSYDGFSMIAETGNFTGNFRVYGVRN